MSTLSHFLRYIAQKPLRLRSYYRNGLIVQPEVVINDEKKLVYVLNPKVATSTITYYLAKISKTELDKLRIESKVSGSLQTKKKYLNISHLDSIDEIRQLRQKGYFVFSFVRNPYSRLQSFFHSKYQRRPDGLYACKSFAQHLGIELVSGFEDLVSKIIEIPDMIADAHFIPQTTLLFGKNRLRRSDYDFIGTLENFDEDFAQLKSHMNDSEVQKINHTSSEKLTSGIYNDELRNLVYKKYQLDFDVFGYKK